MDYKDQVILITGASSGIGKQLAVDLAARGAIVAGCGRSLERLEATLNAVRPTSPSSTIFVCDVSDAEQVQNMIKDMLARYGKIDILINNAGIGMRRPFNETPLETIEAITRTNYLGAIYCAHAVLPAMIERGRGYLVNISSVAGKIGTLNMAAYCGSKFALNGWSESLYYELKPLGIRVSVICPGAVRTDFNRDFRDTVPKSPRGLIVTPEAVSAQIIRAMEGDRFEVVMPRSMAVLSSLHRHMPRLFRALAELRFRRHGVLVARSGRAQSG